MKVLGVGFVIAFLAPVLPLAQGPDAGLRPPSGDFRAPVPVPPPPGAQPPGSPPRSPGAGKDRAPKIPKMKKVAGR